MQPIALTKHEQHSMDFLSKLSEEDVPQEDVRMRIATQYSATTNSFVILIRSVPPLCVYAVVLLQVL